MTRKRLFWKLYPAQIAILLFSLAALFGYTTLILRNFYFDHTANILETDARLLAEEIKSADPTRMPLELNDICRRLDRETGTRYTLVRPSGVVIADSEQDPAAMDNHADRPEIREALAGKVGRSIRYSFTLKKDLVYVAVPIRLESAGEQPVIVRASMPLPLFKQALNHLDFRIALGGLAVALLAGGLLWWTARRVTRPLQAIARGAARLAEGDFSARVQAADYEESAVLADSLNRMAGQLDQWIRTVTRQQREQEAVLANMNEAVMLIDGEHRIVRLNQAAGRLLGVDPQQATGRLILEVARYASLQKFIGELLEKGQRAETDLLLHDGGERFLMAYGIFLPPTAEKDGAVALIVLHDVTRLKKLENLRREFVANVSHELKTPITSIKGFVETLRDGAIDDPENAKNFLAIVSNHAERLNSIIDDLLFLSKIEQDEQAATVTGEPARLAGIVQSALNICTTRIAEKKAAVELAGDLDLQAVVDPKLLELAVVNLLDNALKYSEAGSRVTIRLEGTPTEARLAVADNGCGIEAEHLPRIFERFYRVDKARSRKLGGTGLGLAIVKHIVKVHRGQVTVQSEPGKGSVFTIHLPRF